MDILVFLAGQRENPPRQIPSARRAIYVAQNERKAHASDFMVKWPGLRPTLTPPNGLIRECDSRTQPGERRSRSDRAALALRRSGLQRQGVQSAAHFGLERLVDDLVLLDS
jgi:hypothetical protein